MYAYAGGGGTPKSIVKDLCLYLNIIEVLIK